MTEPEKTELPNQMDKAEQAIEQRHPESQQEDESQSGVPQKTSLLFERYAIWGMLVFLVVSIWFQITPYIILTVFLIMLYGLLIIWKKKSLQQIESSLQLEKTHIFAEETTSLHASIANNKWLPLIWLEVEMNKTAGLKWEQVRDRYVMRILWLLWYQKVEWDIAIKSERRGVFSLGESILLRSGDGFRFTEIEKQISGYGVELFVFPKLVPVKVPSLSFVAQWGADGRKGGIHEDPLFTRGIREYQHGDEWKRINWQASARTGKLQISEYERMLPRNLLLYIDVQGFNEGAKFEAFLSVIASMAVAYDHQGVKLQYAINGVNHKGQEIGYSGSGAGVISLLEKLAGVTSTTLTKNKLLFAVSVDAPIFIFCEKVTQEHFAWINQQTNKSILLFYLTEGSLATQLGSKARPLTSVMMVESNERD